MREWKAAGPAPRDVDDALWKRFRGAQDTFFGARDAANAELDKEFAANAEVKEALLVEAEALLPVTDLEAAKTAFRDIAERWDAAGKVPRDRMKELEGRIRKVEQAIRGVEDEQWKRSDPEKSRPRRRHGRQARGGDRRHRGRPREGPRPPATRRRRSSELEEPTSPRARQFLEMAAQGAREPSSAEPRVGSLGDAVGVEDAGDRADGLEHGVEVLGVGHLEGEPALGDPVAAGGQAWR